MPVIPIISSLTQGTKVTGVLARTPRKAWLRVRRQLYNLVWPNEEEAAAYLHLFSRLQQEDCYERGAADSVSPTNRPQPPHPHCPCDLCRKYWEGFWSCV